MENRQQVIRRQAGFTLLELMVAIFILAVGLVSVAAMQTMSVRSNGFAMRYTTAVALAQEKIEDFMVMPYTSLPAATQVETNLGSNRNYTRTSTLQANTPFARTTTITVAVTWQGSSVRFQTIRSD